MPVSCFGNAATAAWAERLAPEISITVADPSGFAGAMGELITRGMNGASRDLFILPANPRSQVLELALPSIQQQSQSHDALLRALDALAAGQLSINGEAQAQLESRFLVSDAAMTFQDLTLTADRTFFRSVNDLERAVSQYGYRPVRTRIVSPLDVRVPEPDAAATPCDEIAVWAVGAVGSVLAAFEAACFDIRTKRTVIREPADSAEVLARASVIVALTDDPATVYGLAKFGKPMCAPVCGAAEIVCNLHEFSPWNRIETVNALLMAGDGAVSAPMADRSRFPGAPISAVMSTKPLVSIVMPTFSRPNTLRAGLQRLQRQTYQNIEILVVNNAGTAVDDVVADFPNARLLNRTENTGNATRPRNDGIAQARGAYIALLDDDDLFFPDHVTRMVDALERSGRDAAYSDFFVRFVERADDGSESVWGWDIQKPFGITAYELLVANRLGYFTVFIRRA